MTKRYTKNKKDSKHQIRVGSGKIKGKLIECPPGEIRPMTSKVKEALFSIIGDCSGLTLLDLFSGSGNISIEAYSHNLQSSDLIEMDRGKKEVILKNLKNSGFKDGHLFMSNAFDYCKSCKKDYDLIMVDPPFKMENKEELLDIISEKKLLKKSGILIIHLPKKELLNEIVGDLKNYDTRSYGLNKIMFYDGHL